MGRTTKIILCSLLLLLLCYPLFATIYSAYLNPSSTKVQVYDTTSEEDQGYYTIDKNTVPEGEDQPEMPNGEGYYVASSTTSTKLVYHASSNSIMLIILESYLFAICLSYLLFTNFCKHDLKELFKENKSRVYSFILVGASIGHGFVFGLLYLLQTLINASI